MKKLMIAAAIVCAAAFAEAATVSWQITYSGGPSKKVFANDGSTVWTDIASGNQMAYLCLAGETGNLVNAIKNGDDITASMYLDKTDGTAPTWGTNGQMSSGKNSGNLAAIPTAAQAFELVLVYDDPDGNTYYKVTGQASKAANDDPTVPVGVTFASNNQIYNASWVAAPEPTSGLLLLIGVGALALRRRRA